MGLIGPVLSHKYRADFRAEEEFILGSKQQDGYPRLQQGTSAYAGFRVVWNNSISRRILDSEGNPVGRAKASVMLAQGSQPLLIEEDAYDHRSEGKYEFSQFSTSVGVKLNLHSAERKVRLERLPRGSGQQFRRRFQPVDA